MENDKKQVLRPTGTTAPTITHDPRTPSLMEATNHLIQALHTNGKMKAGKRAGTDDAGIHDYNQTKATKPAIIQWCKDILGMTDHKEAECFARNAIDNFTLSSIEEVERQFLPSEYPIYKWTLIDRKRRSVELEQANTTAHSTTRDVHHKNPYNIAPGTQATLGHRIRTKHGNCSPAPTTNGRPMNYYLALEQDIRSHDSPDNANHTPCDSLAEMPLREKQKQNVTQAHNGRNRKTPHGAVSYGPVKHSVSSTNTLAHGKQPRSTNVATTAKTTTSPGASTRDPLTAVLISHHEDLQGEENLPPKRTGYIASLGNNEIATKEAPCDMSSSGNLSTTHDKRMELTRTPLQGAQQHQTNHTSGTRSTMLAESSTTQIHQHLRAPTENTQQYTTRKESTLVNSTMNQTPAAPGGSHGTETANRTPTTEVLDGPSEQTLINLKSILTSPKTS